MKLKQVGEFGLIDRIRQHAPLSQARVLAGIGDDCAVLAASGGQARLITTDALVENVHFLRRREWMERLGRKSLAVNVSDIAAMGGCPEAAVISLAIPQEMAVEEVDDFYRGFYTLAEEFGVDVVGGDTTASRDGLFISVTLTGFMPADQVLYRRGARPQDRIYVSGPLGDSAAGLALILGKGRTDPAARQALLRRHLDPVPRLAEGVFFAQSGAATAMIDVSDGLAGDLGHLCQESGCRGRLLKERIPLTSDNLGLGGEHAAFQRALHGGEDYELLLTVRPEAAAALEQAFRERFQKPLFWIGEMTAGRGLTLCSAGRERPLTAEAYDHFKKGGR